MELSHQGRNEAEGDGEVGGMGPLFFCIYFFIFYSTVQAIPSKNIRRIKMRQVCRFFLFFKTVPPGQRKYE